MAAMYVGQGKLELDILVFKVLLECSGGLVVKFLEVRGQSTLNKITMKRFVHSVKFCVAAILQWFGEYGIRVIIIEYD